MSDATATRTADAQIDSRLSAVVSFFVPGVGQFVFNDQSKRGAIVFVAAVLADIIVFVLGSILGVLTLGLGLLLYLLMPVIHAGAAYDAYNQAEKINAGEIQP